MMNQNAKPLANSNKGAMSPSKLHTSREGAAISVEKLKEMQHNQMGGPINCPVGEGGHGGNPGRGDY